MKYVIIEGKRVELAMATTGLFSINLSIENKIKNGRTNELGWYKDMKIKYEEALKDIKEF